MATLTLPHAIAETLTGAQLLVRLLERQDVRIVAGIPGGAILPVYDALSQSASIRHVLSRHEQGAGFIAQGMARSSGRPAVCLASSGPGATNLLTAIADAKLDSIPLIAITGQVPTSLLGTDAFQEVDTYGLSMPITKHNFLLKSAQELLDVVPRAFRIAASGRPGPVLIDIPKDLQSESVAVATWPPPGGADRPLEPDAQSIQQAADVINAAQRPILYLGGGVIHAGAAARAIALAEAASLPAVMTLMALGSMPHGHPLCMGMLGMHGARYTNTALDECDVLIAAGARFDDRATGKVSAFCPHAKVVHIDIDPSEHGKIKAADVAIHCDLHTALAALAPALSAPPARLRWLQRISELKEKYPLRMPGADDIRRPYGLIRAVADCLGDDATIVTDVGQHQMWVAQAYPLRRPRQWLTSGGLGTMGFGLPAAIGAALAVPDNIVACFTGDGSVLMNVQELITAAELQVNVKLIVMNNAALGLVSQQQTLFYGERLFASRYSRTPDFVGLAASCGWRGVDLDRQQDPRAALADALRTHGPTLIHTSIDACEHVLPMVPPGAANCQTIEG